VCAGALSPAGHSTAQAAATDAATDDVVARASVATTDDVAMAPGSSDGWSKGPTEEKQDDDDEEEENQPSPAAAWQCGDYSLLEFSDISAVTIGQVVMTYVGHHDIHAAGKVDETYRVGVQNINEDGTIAVISV
jgi:hypothetical protein